MTMSSNIEHKEYLLRLVGRGTNENSTFIMYYVNNMISVALKDNV